MIADLKPYAAYKKSGLPCYGGAGRAAQPPFLQERSEQQSPQRGGASRRASPPFCLPPLCGARDMVCCRRHNPRGVEPAWTEHSEAGTFPPSPLAADGEVTGVSAVWTRVPSQGARHSDLAAWQRRRGTSARRGLSGCGDTQPTAVLTGIPSCARSWTAAALAPSVAASAAHARGLPGVWRRSARSYTCPGAVWRQAGRDGKSWSYAMEIWG